MGTKRFWLGMNHRNILKRTDKVMIGNIDNQEAEFIDLAELLAVLTTTDLPEGANRKYITAAQKTTLENMAAGLLTLIQAQQYFYPINENPAGYLTAASGLASAKLSGAIAAGLIPNLDAAKIVTGILAAARMPDLAASKITSGEFDVARIPVLPATKFEGIATELAKYILNTAIGAVNGVTPLDVNVKVPVGYIPNLDAAKIVSGILSEDRIPDLYVRLTQLVDYYTKTETQAFTADEKTKLAGLESPKWKGNYLTPAALRIAFPEGEAEAWHNNEAGWTADVDAGVGQLLQRYIWDASDYVWREQASGTGSDTAAQVKAKYEANPDTNALTDIRKDKVDGLPATVESTAGAQAKADAAKIAAQNYSDLRGDSLEDRIAANEVGKVAIDGAKVLTDENYSLAEKNKLAAIEDAKWKGNYPTIEALIVDYPEGAGQVWHQDKGGWIGDVDAGVAADVVRYIWDASDLKWVIQAGASTSETAASIKTKYESNVDTNAFTDALLAKINSITAIFTTALKTSYDTAASWVSTNGTNVMAHLTKFTVPLLVDKIPVSQADGSIVWEAKPTGGGGTSTALRSFTAYLDIVNGDNATAELTNPAKPFKTATALFNSLSNDYTTYWTITILGGGAVAMPQTQPRNIIWESTASAILDYTNLALGYCFVYNDIPSEWRFLNGNISLKSAFVGVMVFGYSISRNNIRITGHLNSIDWESNNSQSASAPIISEWIDNDVLRVNQINLYTSAGGRSLQTQYDVFATIMIGKINANATANYIWGNVTHTKMRTIVGEIAGANGCEMAYASTAGTIEINKITLTGGTLKIDRVKLVKFNNCTYPDNALISFHSSGTVQVEGELIGNTPIGVSFLYDTKFKNFTCYLKKLTQYSNTAAGWTFEDCKIRLETSLCTYSRTYANIGTFKGHNTFTSDVAGSELITFGGGSLATAAVNKYGTLRTNCVITAIANFVNHTPNSY